MEHYLMINNSNPRYISEAEYDYWMIHILPFGWVII